MSALPTAKSINQSSGVQAIDAETCRLVETKLRFRPAHDDQGRPYVAYYGYQQFPVGRWELLAPRRVDG